MPFLDLSFFYLDQNINECPSSHFYANEPGYLPRPIILRKVSLPIVTKFRIANTPMGLSEIVRDSFKVAYNSQVFNQTKIISR